MKAFLKLFTYLSKRRFKRFFILFWVLLYPVSWFLYFVSFFQNYRDQDMGTVRVAMTTNNPYHYVFEQAGDYFGIIDVILQEGSGKNS